MASTIVRLILILSFAAAVIMFVAGIMTDLIERHRERRAEEERKGRPWDPALCDHQWETVNTGHCTNTNASTTVGAGRQTWKVEKCPRCGAKRFSCTNRSCARHKQCQQTYEADGAQPGELERTLEERVADKNGFEYNRYHLRDRFGHERTGYCRVIPTTIPFSCPDCGGMVVGVGARRVWPGTAGPDPTAYRCEECGRQESYDFGVPRIVDREGDPQFSEPAGMQPVCPRGGKHEWVLEESWSEIDFPPGVDSCLENMSLMQEYHYGRWRCTKCGEVRVESDA